MEKYITDERTGLKYELVGDYYLIAGDDEPEHEPIGIWGQRHGRFLQEHKHCTYSVMLMTGKLENYLRDVDRQAEAMLSQIVQQMAAQEEITETLEVENQMLWVQRMNAIREAAVEIVKYDLICA